MQKEITLPNGISVKATPIENFESYRGFWAEIDGVKFIATFNTNNVKSGYSQGFDTGGMDVAPYIYNKLEKGNALTKNERIAFYEIMPNPTDCMVQLGGVWYDFSEVLTPHKYVNAWLLDDKPSEQELDSLRGEFPKMKDWVLENKEEEVQPNK